MKAQKLGLVLGINIAAACLMLQGCKAKQGGKVRPSPTDRVTVISSPAPRNAPAAAPVAEPQGVAVQPASSGPVISTTPTVAEPAAPAPQTIATAPSAVRPVKPLPAAPTQKAVKAKPAAAPAPASPAATAAPAATAEYVVKPGDTLFLISKRTNYRQSAILAANPGLNAARIRVGQKIKLPGAAPVAAAAPAVAKAAAPAPAAKDKEKLAAAPAPAAKDKDKEKQAAAPAPAAANTKAPVKTKTGFVAYEGPTKEYVVKSGDSLGKIAKETGISIRALKALNGLQQDKLRLGQKLKIPAEKQVVSAAKPAAAKEAAAKPATVAKAEDAKAAAPAVKEAAAPAPAATEAAAKPAAAAAPAPTAEAAAKPADAAKADDSAAAAPVEEPAPATLTYTAKEGDDLVSIAIAYGISPSALMDINDLKPTDEIKPGQVLKLPANAKPNAQ